MEAEARQKNDQLDELYGLIDSMQENVNQLESESCCLLAMRVSSTKMLKKMWRER